MAVQSDDAATAGHLWTLAERIEQQVGFRMLHAQRARYERTLTPALRESREYKNGVANAAALDPLAAVADLLRR